MSQVINLENTVKVIPNRLPPIYSSTVKTCVGGVIELEESINKYSIYISEATEITIDSSKLTQEYLENYPLEFMLRVSCLSSFDITWGSDIQCSITFSIPSEMIIQFNKSAGGMYEGTIISSDSLQKENLYEATVSDIASTYVMSQSGGMRNPYLLPTWNITDGYQPYNKISLYPDPNGNIYFCVQFNEQVCATDFEFAIQGWYGNAPSEIKMWASNDGVNYVLYSDFAGLTLKTDAWFNYEFQSVGWYKYYKLTLVPSNSNYVAISAFHLRGFKYPGRYSENSLIIPVMNSLSDGGYEISTNAVVTGNLYDITKSTATTDITLAFDSSIGVYNRYVKYTLPEATAADLMNFNFGEESTSSPNHFEVYGSIDDENWDLIYGFQSPVKYTSNTNFMSNLAGNSYKYFKIIFIKNAAENTTFKIRYWQLSQRFLIDYRANSLMPVMNSLSQDGYGVIPCSSWDQSTHIGWHVFDNNTSTYWATAAQAAPWFMVIKLPYPQVCNMFKFTPRSGYETTQTPKSFQILGSNDENTWTVLKEFTGQINWGGLEQREYYMDNTNAYQYYKFNCTELVSSTATGLSCSEMAFCNLNIWTQYTEAVDTLIMPVMTSNPQDGYTLSASTTQEGNVLNLFKQNGTADWWVAGNNAFPCIVTVQSEAAFICNLIKLQARPSYYEQSPSEFYLEGSNDEEEWTQLYYSPTQSSWGSGEIRSFYFENDTAYTHYRIRGLSAVGSGYFAMSTMNLYQRTFIVHPAS